MGQSLRQRFNPKSIAPKLKPLARPMLYLSLGLHGLLLLIPINVPEPPEPNTASTPDSLDRVSIANLAPSAPENATSAPEPSPEPAPAETPTTPPPQAAAPAPTTPSPRPTPPETPAPAPEVAETPPPTTPAPETADPAPSETSEPDSTSPSSDADTTDPVVSIEGPPPPPEPPEPLSTANGTDAYVYNPDEVAQAGDETYDAYNVWFPWWETVEGSGNFATIVPEIKNLSLPHTANICLAEPPKVATLGAVIDESGEIVGDPDLLSGTGYAVLNEQAIELAKEYEFSPPDNTMEAYVFRVDVDYDAENCVEPGA